MPSLESQIVFTRHMQTPGERAALHRRVKRGELHAIARGAFLPIEQWRHAAQAERHRAAVFAASQFHPGTVFTAQSAALMWQRPLLGQAPAKPQAVAFDRTGGRSSALLQRMVVDSMTPVDIHGIAVVPLACAVVEVARHAPLEVALVAADHALSAHDNRETWPRSERTTKTALIRLLETTRPLNGARARRAIDMADGLSGSPGESLSRAVISAFGVPAPVLQQRFADELGLVGYVDFFWPEFGVIGEFDGVAKYTREEFRSGRTPSEIVVEEKLREDRLRALGFRVIRWVWEDLMNPTRLARKLHAAGFPLGGRNARAALLHPPLK
jgi:hypothetical protein